LSSGRGRPRPRRRGESTDRDQRPRALPRGLPVGRLGQGHGGPSYNRLAVDSRGRFRQGGAPGRAQGPGSRILISRFSAPTSTTGPGPAGGGTRRRRRRSASAEPGQEVRRADGMACCNRAHQRPGGPGCVRPSPRHWPGSRPGNDGKGKPYRGRAPGGRACYGCPRHGRGKAVMLYGAALVLAVGGLRRRPARSSTKRAVTRSCGPSGACRAVPRRRCGRKRVLTSIVSTQDYDNSKVRAGQISWSHASLALDDGGRGGSPADSAEQVLGGAPSASPVRPRSAS